jgi:GntR family transcriptional regulator
MNPEDLELDAAQAMDAPSSGPPRYQQIVAELRKEIEDGTLPVGSVLPSESDLRERFSVSRHTVREAIRNLREIGLVESRQGAASRVMRPHQPLYTYSVNNVAELFQYATDVRYEIDKTTMLVADEALSESIGCVQGSRWLRFEGFRYSHDTPVPVCWTEVYIASEFGGVAVHIGRKSGTVYSFIEDMYGVRVESVDQSLFGAVIPDQALEKLVTDAQSNVILIKRTYRLADKTVPFVALNYHPLDRLRLNWTLKRSDL